MRLKDSRLRYFSSHGPLTFVCAFFFQFNNLFIVVLVSCDANYDHHTIHGWFSHCGGISFYLNPFSSCIIFVFACNFFCSFVTFTSQLPWLFSIVDIWALKENLTCYKFVMIGRPLSSFFEVFFGWFFALFIVLLFFFCLPFFTFGVAYFQFTHFFGFNFVIICGIWSCDISFYY